VEKSIALTGKTEEISIPLFLMGFFSIETDYLLAFNLALFDSSNSHPSLSAISRMFPVIAEYKVLSLTECA